MSRDCTVCGEHSLPLIHGRAVCVNALVRICAGAISDGRPYRDSYFLVNGHIWSMESVEESLQSYDRSTLNNLRPKVSVELPARPINQWG